MGKQNLMEKLKLKGQQLKKIVTQNNHKPLRDVSTERKIKTEKEDKTKKSTRKNAKFSHVIYHSLE